MRPNLYLTLRFICFHKLPNNVCLHYFGKDYEINYIRPVRQSVCATIPLGSGSVNFRFPWAYVCHYTVHATACIPEHNFLFSGIFRKISYLLIEPFEEQIRVDQPTDRIVNTKLFMHYYNSRHLLYVLLQLQILLQQYYNWQLSIHYHDYWLLYALLQLTNLVCTIVTDNFLCTIVINNCFMLYSNCEIFYVAKTTSRS